MNDRSASQIHVRLEPLEHFCQQYVLMYQVIRQLSLESSISINPDSNGSFVSLSSLQEGQKILLRLVRKQIDEH